MRTGTYRFRQRARRRDTARQDRRLSRCRPGSVGDSLAGKVDHRIRPLEGAGPCAARPGIPADVVSGKGAWPPRQHLHLTTFVPPGVGEGTPEKPAAAGDDDPHNARAAAAASASPRPTSTRVSTSAPAMKKTMTESTAARLLPNSVIEPKKMAGPAIPANFSNTEKKPKNSDDLWRGIIRAKRERLSAWLPPCTRPTRNARAKKCQTVLMKYPSTLMPV